MRGTEERYREDIARVRAALAEGNCPNGHKLSHGGDRWGSCDTCHISWAAGDTNGYTRRAVGRTDGYWLVTEQGEDWVYEFTGESARYQP